MEFAAVRAAKMGSSLRCGLQHVRMSLAPSISAMEVREDNVHYENILTVETKLRPFIPKINRHELLARDVSKTGSMTLQKTCLAFAACPVAKSTPLSQTNGCN